MQGLTCYNGYHSFEIPCKGSDCWSLGLYFQHVISSILSLFSRYQQSGHSDAIMAIKYLSHNQTVVSISRDPTASIQIRHVHGKLDTYVFKLSWGVRCFDYQHVRGDSLLVTGSNDKLVRVWNPVVTAK